MFLKNIFFGIFIVLLSICTLFSAVILCEQEDGSWAFNDLVFARDAILENHPGVYNRLDPDFYSNVSKFFQVSHMRLIEAFDDNMRKQILRQFGRAFNDAHLRMIFPQETPSVVAVADRAATRGHFLCDIADTVCYVKLPTFDPNEQEVDAIRSIINTMPTVRSTSYIVFDVRGNGGGSSIWGKQIVDALFGVGYTYHKRACALEKQYIEWRASASNIAYMSTDVRVHVNKNFDKDNKVTEWVEHIIDGMQKAYDAKEELYRDLSNKFSEVSDIAPADSLCTSTIIVLMDDRCASASLGFIDELKLMGTQVILVGKQTMADSLYMECRFIPLPSGKGTIAVPIKVYRNRPRGHNVPYNPDIEFTGDINDIQVTKHYILSLLDNKALVKTSSN